MTRPRFAPDLLAVAAIAAACAACIYLPAAEPARAPLGAVLGLVGVGYALTCALWGSRRPTGAELALYTLALSIAATICVAVALDAARLELTQDTLVIALVSVTLVAAFAAWLRRPASAPLDIRVRTVLAVCVVPIAIFAAAVTVLRKPIANENVAGYTQLFGTRSAPEKITVGIKSAEQEPVDYVLRITIARRPTVTRKFRLASGQSWSREFAAPAAGERAAAKAVLYRADDLTRPYRTVSLAQ